MKKAQQKGGAGGLPQQRRMLSTLQYYGSKRGLQGVSPCQKEINVAYLSKNNQKGGAGGLPLPRIWKIERAKIGGGGVRIAHNRIIPTIFTNT